LGLSNLFRSIVEWTAAPVLGLLSLFGIVISRELAALLTLSLSALIVFLAVKMMRSSFTKIAFRNVPRRKLRNGLTVLAIIVGVALVIGVNATLDSVLHQFEDTARKATGNVDIIISSLQDTPFNQDVLTAVREVDGVSNASARVINTAVVFKPGSDVKVATLIGVNSSSDFDYLELDITRKLSFITQHVELDVNGNQAVVDESLNYSIGDKFMLYVVTHLDQIDQLDQFEIDQLDRSKLISFTVVAINHTNRVFSGQGRNIYIDFVTAQRICNCLGEANAIIVNVAEIGLTDKIVNELNSRLSLTYIVNPVKKDFVMMMDETTLGLASGFQVMSVIGLCVSIVIVLNTMYTNVGERTEEVGILRSTGASTGQVFWLFFSESFILGIVGAVVGIATGIIITSVFKYSINQLFFLPQKFAIDLSVFQIRHLMVGAGAGVITAVIGGVFPSLKACKIDVVKALRPTMRKAGKPRTALKLIAIGLTLTFFGVFVFVGGTFFSEVSWGIFIGALLASVPVLGIIFLTAGLLRIGNSVVERSLFLFKSSSKIISRNIERNLARSTACFALIGLSLSFVVVMGSAQTGVIMGIEDVIKSFASSDLTVISETSISRSFDNELTNIGDGALINRTTSIFIVPQRTMLLSNLSLNKTLVTLVVIDPSTYSKVMSTSFSEDTPSDVFTELDKPGRIILTAPLTRSLNTSIGDVLAVSNYSNTTTTWINFTVVGVAEGFWLELMSFSGLELSKTCYISYKSLYNFFPNYKDEASVFFVEVKPDQDVDRVKDRVMELYGTEFKLTVVTYNDVLREVSTEVNKIFLTLYSIVLFAIVNAVIGMMSIMMMNVTMRQREIGILRSQGMSKSQVVGSIIGEGLVLGVVGFVLATALGLIFHSITVSYMSFGGFKMPFIISFDSIVIALALGVLTSVISAAYPAYRASKMKIVESLRH
jgi:ABC-type antimicrobial peptide transport system permease subunit